MRKVKISVQDNKGLMLLMLTLIVFLSGVEVVHTQAYLVFSDTSELAVFDVFDTISVNPSYSTSTEIDVDFDGTDDLRIICYKTPLQNLPDANNIMIEKINNSEVEMLKTNWLLYAYNQSDSVQIQPNDNWDSGPEWRLLYFDVLAGPIWASSEFGIDSSSVYNQYVVYKKKSVTTIFMAG